MEQYAEHPLLQDIPRERVLCFTGHRPEKLPARRELQILTETLHYYINISVTKGYTHFLTGLADGVDYLAAEYLFTLRQRYPILQVIGVQPCEDYEEFYCSHGYSLPRLEYMLRNVNGLIVLPGSYRSHKAFRERNYYMVDRSAAIIAVCAKGRSGSMQTLGYAMRQGLSYCRICLDNAGSYPLYPPLTPETWEVERCGF